MRSSCIASSLRELGPGPAVKGLLCLQAHRQRWPSVTEEASEVAEGAVEVATEVVAEAEGECNKLLQQ